MILVRYGIPCKEVKVNGISDNKETISGLDKLIGKYDNLLLLGDLNSTIKYEDMITFVKSINFKT